MADLTAETLAERIFDVGLLDMTQIESAWSELGTRDASLDDFVSLMLRKQWLTNLQVDRLLKNERDGYFYGKYKLLYLVGAGTFARVYRAVHVESDEVVAVKVLRSRHLAETEKREHFLAEAKLVMPLRHENIVPIYEVGEQRRRPYMVMEFVEGQNLRDFIKVRKKMDVAEALDLIDDIVSGLGFAVSRNVTHRDLKLTNVLVTSSRRGKLVDFGLAAIAAYKEQHGKATTSQRSIDYAALERLTGVRNGDPRSDIYFAGCILYHLLSGHSPLSETRDRAQRMNLDRYRGVKPISDLEPHMPDHVVALVNKAMELEVDRRFQSAAEFLADIRTAKRKSEHGEAEYEVVGDPASKRTVKRGAVEREGENHSVMVVESNIEMQDVLRELLKRRGYRVLVISDCERALKRFEDEPPAECVIFCTSEMGQQAIETFNTFGQQEHTRDLPAVLFLDETHTELAETVQTAPHRVLLKLPLKVRKLRTILVKLLSLPQAEARD